MRKRVRAPQVVGDSAAEAVVAKSSNTVARGGGHDCHDNVLQQTNNCVVLSFGLVARVPNAVAVRDDETLLCLNVR